VLLVVLAQPAFGHASLISAVPADGSVLAEKPPAFHLTFNESVSPLVVRLIGPNGDTRTLDVSQPIGATLAIPAPATMVRGTHALSWRVVSEDGHPVGGTLIFSIGEVTAGSASTPEMTDGALRSAIWLAKLVIYVGLFFGVGGAFGSAVMRCEALPIRMMTISMLIALPVIALSVGLQGLDALGLPLAELGRLTVWKTGLSTTYAWTAFGSLSAMLLGLASTRVRGRPLAAATSALAAVAAGLALAASGHAGAASPQWLTRPAVFMHAVAIAFWAGSLMPLYLALKENEAGAVRSLLRFSVLAPYVVAAIVAAGAALAFVQVERFERLWTTAYGRVLLVKLALVGALFLFAAYNRWQLTGRVERGDRGATRRMRRSISAELVIMLAILGTVAIWRFTPPPRALPDVPITSVAAHLHAAGAMAQLTVAPARAGPVSASITIMSGEHGPLAAEEVEFIVANPSAGIEPIRRTAERQGGGVWRVESLTLPVPGRWAVRIDILVSDFEKTMLEGELEIPSGGGS
jgi:copper transport protein